MHHDDEHPDRTPEYLVPVTRIMSYRAEMGRLYVQTAALNRCWCVFGISCVGAFEITTPPPSGTTHPSRRAASGMPSDTDNPKGVKAPQQDKIRDEARGKCAVTNTLIDTPTNI